MIPHYLVMVCQNLRAPTDVRGCCQLRGSEALLARLKAVRKERGLGELYRATQSGCLGGCESGPTVVVARTGSDGQAADVVYYSKVKSGDVDEIVSQHLEKGSPVERLRANPDWVD